MGFKAMTAVLAAAVPLALAAQPTPTDTTTATITIAPAAKKPYVPHKTPQAKKTTGKSKAPVPPRKPSNIPAVIYDKQGNAIPTSPDAYDVSSATRKK